MLPIYTTNQGDGTTMVCPDCDDFHIHAVGSVEIYDNQPGEGRWSFRIPMVCENGHDFEIRIEQHKGETHVGTLAWMVPMDGQSVAYLGTPDQAVDATGRGL